MFADLLEYCRRSGGGMNLAFFAGNLVENEIASFQLAKRNDDCPLAPAGVPAITAKSDPWQISGPELERIRRLYMDGATVAQIHKRTGRGISTIRRHTSRFQVLA
jgi:hypothetical protein